MQIFACIVTYTEWVNDKQVLQIFNCTCIKSITDKNQSLFDYYRRNTTLITAVDKH